MQFKYIIDHFQMSDFHLNILHNFGAGLEIAKYFDDQGR
jgi:hypothetical protein